MVELKRYIATGAIAIAIGTAAFYSDCGGIGTKSAKYMANSPENAAVRNFGFRKLLEGSKWSELRELGLRTTNESVGKQAVDTLAEADIWAKVEVIAIKRKGDAVGNYARERLSKLQEEKYEQPAAETPLSVLEQKLDRFIENGEIWAVLKVASKTKDPKIKERAAEALREDVRKLIKWMKTQQEYPHHSSGQDVSDRELNNALMQHLEFLVDTTALFEDQNTGLEIINAFASHPTNDEPLQEREKARYLSRIADIAKNNDVAGSARFEAVRTYKSILMREAKHLGWQRIYQTYLTSRYPEVTNAAKDAILKHYPKDPNAQDVVAVRSAPERAMKALDRLAGAGRWDDIGNFAIYPEHPEVRMHAIDVLSSANRVEELGELAQEMERLYLSDALWNSSRLTEFYPRVLEALTERGAWPQLLKMNSIFGDPSPRAAEILSANIAKIAADEEWPALEQIAIGNYSLETRISALDELVNAKKWESVRKIASATEVEEGVAYGSFINRWPNDREIYELATASTNM